MARHRSCILDQLLTSYHIVVCNQGGNSYFYDQVGTILEPQEAQEYDGNRYCNWVINNTNVKEEPEGCWSDTLVVSLLYYQ